jgi:hypothetical protein
MHVWCMVLLLLKVMVNFNLYQNGSADNIADLSMKSENIVCSWIDYIKSPWAVTEKLFNIFFKFK